jgi:hypothetical protein
LTREGFVFVGTEDAVRIPHRHANAENDVRSIDAASFFADVSTNSKLRDAAIANGMRHHQPRRNDAAIEAGSVSTEGLGRNIPSVWPGATTLLTSLKAMR